MAKKPTTKRTKTLDVNSPKLRNFIVSALKDGDEPSDPNLEALAELDFSFNGKLKIH